MQIKNLWFLRKNNQLSCGIILPQLNHMKNNEKMLLTGEFFCVYSGTNDLTIFYKRENT